MKKLILLVSLCFLIQGSSIYPQVKVNSSFNNYFRYGTGQEFKFNEERSKEYLENIADAKIVINDLIFGVRYEISDPIEFGKNFKGIRKRYIEYNGNGEINLRAGDFWEVISKGLSLNTFENRQLAFDTGIDGLRASYKKTFGKKNPVKFKVKLLAGDISYTDFLNSDRTENYKIRDVNFEISPFKAITIGTNIVYSEGNIPIGNTSNRVKTVIPEFYGDINFREWNFYLSYANKQSVVSSNEIILQEINAGGDALYSSLSYSRYGFGVTLEYKNYRFDLTTPDNQSRERPTKMLPFQNPPTVIKEHTSALLSRSPHVVDFNDEVGAQLEILLFINDNSLITFNSSIASKHYSFIDSDSSFLVKYKAEKRDLNFLPGFDEKYSPYIEISLESETYIKKDIFVKAGLFRQQEVLYNYSYPDFSDKKTSYTIPVELRYTFSKIFTFKIHLEQQWSEYSLREPGFTKFTNQFFSIGFSRSPDLSLTLNSEFTSDNAEQSGKRSWVSTHFTYNITSSNVITLSYGSERGGFSCMSGICRYVNPFNGFRINISSKF